MARRLENTPRPPANNDLGCPTRTWLTLAIFQSPLTKPVYRISLPHYLVKDSSILPRLIPRRFASFIKTFWTSLEYWTVFFCRFTSLLGKLMQSASLLSTYFGNTFP